MKENRQPANRGLDRRRRPLARPDGRRHPPVTRVGGPEKSRASGSLGWRSATRAASVRKRAGIALAAVGVALTAGLAGLGPSSVQASSHREAPLVAADPAIDNTDVYAFDSKDRPGYVTFIANFIPFEEPNGGPNFYPFSTHPPH